MNDPLITRWLDLKAKIEVAKKLQDEELVLRKQIVDKYFKDAKEGVNTHKESGLIIKADCKLTRKVDLQSVDFKKLRELGVDQNRIFRYKAELDLKEYRNLQVEQLEFVNNYVTTTPATPTLTIELGE